MTVWLGEREHQIRAGDQASRAIGALLSCAARQGVRKTTLDDVAREAGCSRATLYRYFASKQAVLDAALRTEARRISAALAAAAATAVTVEDAVVALLVTAGAELGQHPALRFVATFEPEKVLPHLAFAGGDQFLAAATETLAPMLAPHVGAEHAPRAAEWITRVGLCLLFDPVPPVDLDDEPAVRAYAREFIVPAVAADPVRSQPPTTTRR
jgi:TetR/AcrR family transcriptional repressor of uid operon